MVKPNLRDARPLPFVERVKSHPVIAGLLVVSTVVAGIAAFGKNLLDLNEYVAIAKAHPTIVSLDLSQASHGYELTEDGVFGMHDRTLPTIRPTYPFVDGARAVLLITLQNPTDKDLLVTSVEYIVEEVGGVRGGAPGPIESKERYVHTLRHEIGPQKKKLQPVFRIPPQSAEAFELELNTDSEEPGLGWVMTLRIHTTAGDVTTERIQAYLGRVAAREASKPLLVEGLTQRSPARPFLKHQVPQIPTLSHRDNAFQRAEITEEVASLDELDRDVLYMRASSMPLSGLLTARTHTDPPVAYSQFIPPAKLERLSRSLRGAHAQ